MNMGNRLLTLLCLAIPFTTFAQVNAPLAQAYNKEITQYMVKEFIIREVLQIPPRQTIEVEINALTSSASGELTTVIYDCQALKKRGLVFGFWNEHFNEHNLAYKGYAFKNFEFENAKEMLEELER